MKKLTEQNAARYTLVFIAITFVVRILIAAYTGLGIGESYYFRGALSLELSYFDQPPLFFWLSWLSIKVLGLSTFALRFPAVILFAGTSWFLFLLSRKLFNAKAGFWAVAIMNLSAVFTVAIACWFQPDAPLMFFWMAAAYYIARVMDINQDQASSRNAYMGWLWVGVLMGLATLSKYHVLFLFAGVFMFVVANKNQRHWLRHPGPYLAVLLTLIIAFPVIWWNYKNDWASFVFQGSRAGDGGEFKLHPEWFLRSIGGQALWLLPWVWVPIIRQFIRSYKERNTSLSYSFVFWTSVLPIVFFTVVTLWADLQYHFHWQAPGYMMLFMPLGYVIDKNLNGEPKQARSTRRWLRFSTGFTVIVITVLSLHMVTGFWQSYGPKWIVGLAGDTDDPTIQGIDYDDIYKRFEKEGWFNNDHLFAGAPRWWLTGKVDWALKGKKDIICFNNDPRNMAFLVDPNKLKGYDCVVIGQRHQVNVDNDVKPFFDSVEQLPDIAIMRNGVDELHLQVYYCKNFHVPAQERNDLPLYKQLTGRPPFGK
ncbi:glycosyltransferase family 39 protein [Mucilaginibacter sp. UR6-1]|uniref:ArnT family glycosyltransferase n=1 Tax=Mucilaginibacter sp. UR6-1 TaxID=1435643 RepID=UPI001E3E3B73|nr:glycosyltransferase family 39 protein [Mucilaginibacter sp. UR6-1]MCC8409980.1 glycosyltransferase family 39 protein [Mucilaginibacter sp. UR6-1]